MEEIAAAESRLELRCLQTIQGAFDKQWTSVAWTLERRWPSRYSISAMVSLEARKAAQAEEPKSTEAPGERRKRYIEKVRKMAALFGLSAEEIIERGHAYRRELSEGVGEIQMDDTGETGAGQI